jgi:hypothetical protein
MMSRIRSRMDAAWRCESGFVVKIAANIRENANHLFRII